MLELTTRTKELLRQTKVEIQLIVEIDGLDFVFGVSPVRSLWKIGDANIRIGDPGLFIGGIVTNPKSKNLIDSSASSRTISQQLEIERGVSSVSTIKIRVLDLNDFATGIFSPSPTEDILGRGCTIYIGLEGASHPEDSIRVFDGMIDDCTFGAGFVDLNISHPEQFKRQAIFPKWESEILTALPASTDPGAVTIGIVDLLELIELPAAQGCHTYFRLDKEVLQFTGINKELNQLSNLTSRGMLQTARLSHDIDDQIESFYFFQRNPIELSLMLLCSRKPTESQYYVENIRVDEVQHVETGEFRVLLKCDAGEITKYNLQINDDVTLFPMGAGTHPEANSGSFKIAQITYDGLTAIIYGTASGFVSDIDNKYSLSAISKWNLLPDGCGIPNRYIDFEGFDNIKSVHGSELATCEIFLKDTIDDAKEFIDQHILRPQGLYSLPRKGRISIGKTVPPVANKETKVLNESNILNPDNLKIGRSINKNFYNAVIFKYDEDPNEDKFLSGSISVDAQSFSRIKVGNRPLLIEARSLRKGADTSKVINSQIKRILERYKFAAETIPVEVDFETGVNIDVGDTAICQLQNLKVTDITSGTRNFAPRLMEVTNKALNIARGVISLELTNTIFEVDGRYGTISPSSHLAAGSTSTLLKLKKSFSRKAEGNEKGKWDQYVGQEILIRDTDWNETYYTVITDIDPINDAIMVNDIGLTPLENYIVESPKYDDTNKNNMLFWKRIHSYLNPTVEIDSVSSTNFMTVALGDITKFIPGSVIVVHDKDFNNISNETTVKEVNGATGELTLSQNLNYLPAQGHVIDLIGFIDGGLPYRIV